MRLFQGRQIVIIIMIIIITIVIIIIIIIQLTSEQRSLPLIITGVNVHVCTRVCRTSLDIAVVKQLFSTM